MAQDGRRKSALEQHAAPRRCDMAMQGLTCRTPPAAFWLDSHQTKQAMHDSYDVLRPPMLDSMPSRPTFDLGLAADTSPETLPGDGVRVVRREGGCSGGLGPPETHRATTIRALVTSVRPRSSHVMMACVDRYIQRYIWGTPSCSSASTFDDATLTVAERLGGGVPLSRSHHQESKRSSGSALPVVLHRAFDLFVYGLPEVLTSRAYVYTV